jgi:hypothetical protein
VCVSPPFSPFSSLSSLILYDRWMGIARNRSRLRIAASLTSSSSCRRLMRRCMSALIKTRIGICMDKLRESKKIAEGYSNYEVW